MSVYKRGKVYWVKFQASGKTIRQSTGESSKRAAQECEKQLRFEYAQEKHYQRTGAPSVRRYSDALLRWVETEAPDSMLSHARNTRPYLDHVLLHLVPVAASEMKAEMMKNGLSPQTINRRLAVVKRILNLCYTEWGWINEPLAMKIKLLSEAGLSRETYLSKDEVANLVNAITNESVKNIVIIAAYTGLRKSEILKLQEENWKPPYIILGSNTKSKRPRTVPVIEEIQHLVKPPFKVDEYDFRREFEKAREEIGRPDIRFHDLRHTFASWLASDPSVPLSLIRDLLGHSTLAVTSKYAHLRSDHHAKIEQVLGTKKGTI